MKFSRRQALAGLTSTLLLPACGGNGKTRRRSGSGGAFLHGVASGDPAPESVVLWTRVSGSAGPVAVDWQLAADPDLRRTAARGTLVTDASRDHTVKVVAENLEPGRTYYYRFSANGEASPTGRTKTLPVGRVDRLTIAVASCSNYPFGYFNAYEAIAEDPDVDVAVHLGDYLYEYDENGYGGDAGKRLGRVHAPRHETVTLDDYRMRHAQYKADPGSRALHAAHPLIPTWDDHESTNNPWQGGAQNHQPDEGDWATRRAASLRAYYEWMPVREPADGRTREQRWAHFRFGDLASLYTLESRHTGRSRQISFADHEDALTDTDAARRFYAEVVAAPSRRMLSPAMESFLAAELAESVHSGRRWRILANQTILARVAAPDVDEPAFRGLRAEYERPDTNAGTFDFLTRLGKLGIPFNMDAWDGYPVARERLYRLAAEAGARDLLAITGDTHVFWQNRLADDAGTPMGVELGTSAITSPRGFRQLGDAPTSRFDALVAAKNEGVVWADGRSRGYVRLTLTPGDARADYVTVSTIESPRYTTSVLRSVDIARRDGTLVYT